MSISVANRKAELVYPELSYAITGILFRVHNTLGRFRRERQYADAVEAELKKAGLSYQRESTNVSHDRYDFLVEDKVILELKAKPFVSKDDYYQTLRYLQGAGLKLALLVNFRNIHLRPKRLLN